MIIRKKILMGFEGTSYMGIDNDRCKSSMSQSWMRNLRSENR